MEMIGLPRLFEGRLQTLFLIFTGAFAILVSALFYTQVFQGGRYQELATHNRVRRILVEAPRGRILDRNGVILADNRPRFDLAIVREELPREKTEYVASLADFLAMEQKSIWKALQTTATVPYLPAILRRDLDISTLTRVEENAEEHPALQIQVQPTRSYAFGETAAHLLGLVGKIPEEEVEAWKEKGVSPQETIGKSGVERVFDSSLRGTSGGMQVQVNNRGYLDKVIGARDPIPGKDLRLTINVALQQALHEAFAGRKGAGVVLDPRTGELLALESSPAYDPNLFTAGAESEKIGALLSDPSRPLFCRPLLGLYSPGSLFKIIIALTFLHDSPQNLPTRKIFCDGKFKLGDSEFRCWKEEGHASLDLFQAIQYSCNVYFYTLGLELGPEKITSMAFRFGFGKPTGFCLGENSGFLPTPQWKKKRFRESWYGGDTANLAIGQGAILSTPLQLAAFFGAIASDGLWRTPLLVAGAPQTEVDLRALAPQIRVVKEGMRRVVQEPDGTGRRAWVENFPAAGKTGTVEVPRADGEKIKHTWFGGFAPFENPEIVVVVLVEEGESGGSTAAPIARKVFEKAAALRSKKREAL